MSNDIALISYAGTTWDLREAQSLTYGRSEGSTIRIRDPRISSDAGVLYVVSGCVWIRHDSSSHALTVIPARGKEETLAIRPKGSKAGVPRPIPGTTTRLQMIGSFQAVEIEIDSSMLKGPSPKLASMNSDPRGTDKTDTIRAELTPAERHLLAVLAEPLIRSGWQCQPLQTKEVAERMNVTHRVIENRLYKLRVKLTGLGVPGLITDDRVAPNHRPGGEFVATLALQAFAHGWADESDLTWDDGGNG